MNNFTRSANNSDKNIKTKHEKNKLPVDEEVFESRLVSSQFLHLVQHKLHPNKHKGYLSIT